MYSGFRTVNILLAILSAGVLFVATVASAETPCLEPAFFDDEMQPWSSRLTSDMISADNIVPTAARLQYALDNDTQKRMRVHAVGRIEVLYDDIIGDQTRRCYTNCTAFLVSREYVITAWHCVRNKQGTVRNLDVQMRLFFTTTPGDQRARTPSKVYKLSVYPVENNFSKELDYAVLKVDKPDAELARYSAISLKDALLDEPEIDGESLAIIHHPAGLPQRVSKCNYSRLQDDTKFDHYCGTDGGSSGGPVIRFSTGAVVGLHVRGETPHAVSFRAIVNHSTLLKSLSKKQGYLSLDYSKEKYVFIGRKSAIRKLEKDSDYSNHAPFGRKLLDWVSRGNPISNLRLRVPNMVAVREQPLTLDEQPGKFIMTLFKDNVVIFDDVVKIHTRDSDELYYGKLKRVEVEPRKQVEVKPKETKSQ